MITLYENMRAVPYAPYYTALELGAFKAEGIDVRVETSPDPSLTVDGLLQGQGRCVMGWPLARANTS